VCNEIGANTLAALLQREWENVSSAFEKAAKFPSIAYPNSAMNFMPSLAFCVQIANIFTRWHCNFQGLSKDGGRADFSNNLRAPLFNEDLSNKPNFISLDSTFKV
jgi:hypothetical protein